MIPVLAIPALNRPDLLRRCLASIDEPVGRLIVIDNSPDGSMGAAAAELGAEVLRLGHNLGVAASWNLAMQVNPKAPWWMSANLDIEFAPRDLARLAAAMEDPSPRVACLFKFGAFGINAACVERVGWFDENFHPAYCEDADYEYRCKLAGVPIIDLPSGSVHLEGGSVSIKQPGTDNGRTYPENVRYFTEKWGGSLRGGESYTSPFNRGGSVADWALDLSRIRNLTWS